MTRARFRLGIDFGTSTTIAVLRRPEGRVQQLLFDGSPLLSSAVLLGPDGRLHTGRDAAHLARSAPERLEPNPKRRVDESSVLLGDAEVDVRELIAAVLRRVATEAARVAGPVDTVTLTHPADWGSGRRALLVEAARLAGFADVALVPEPVAAATYLAATQDVPAGACVVVYDLGAGTCDVTLLRRHAGGFEPVASAGLNDLGGLDVDAVIVGFLQATYGTLWTDATTRRQLWDDVRTAKEMLSRASGTVVMVPALGKEVPLGREQLEGLMRPVLRPSIAMTRALLADAGVLRAEIAGLFLVGGSSRIPLVATMLHESLGIAPVVAEQPELVVAEGALAAAPASGADQLTSASQIDLGRRVAADPHPFLAADPFQTGAAATATALAAATARSSTASPDPSAAPPPPPSPSRSRRRTRNRLLAAAAILVVLAGGGILLSQLPDDGGEQSDEGSQPTLEAVPYDLAKVPADLCAAIDLKPFATLYEREAEPPRPARNLTASGGEASCNIVRLHGEERAVFGVGIRVTPTKAAAAADYKVMIGNDAALNDNPVQPADLGEEAVLFTGKGSTAQLSVRIGVRDGNLTWQMVLTVDRRDRAGWTAAQQQQLRDRLVEVTRAALPKVTADLR
ncbi:Hsp70 family protein [Dactylosporangium sp. NBC_01737]|uniref:Hsp70 family protein n=1 Tax=Dactylosporangium sp. NBC_01737 TaxID=2975959 RepID=UPI002E135192|nr:Hsp70 family protein [Dactylosporangium sp. NBC_01737]